jgi:hypothetical protein
MRSLVSMVVVFLCALSLTAQIDWFFPSPSTEGRQFPRIKKGANGELILTYVINRGSTATIYVMESSDDGRTWKDAGSPGQVRYNTIGLQRQPTTTATASGILHSVWEAQRSDVARMGIFHARSTNNGTSWSHPALVYKDVAGRHLDFSSVATAGETVYVTFLMFEEFDNDGYIHVFLVKSTDQGATWTDPRRVDRFPVGGSCECCIQNVAVGPDGEIAVAFRSNIENRRDIWVCISTDGAETFSSPVLIQDEEWHINGCPSTGPSLTFDQQGNIHLSWRDTRDRVGQDRVYYSRLDKGATQGTANVDLLDGLAEMGEYSGISVDPSGDHVQVVIESSKGVAIQTSRDGGQSFEGEVVDISIVRNASPHSVWTPTRGHLGIWHSVRDGRYDLRLSVASTTSVSERTIEADVWFDGSHLVIDHPNVEGVRIFDALGRMITVHEVAGSSGATTVDLGNLLRGLHFMSITLKSGEVLTGRFLRD